MVHSAKLFKQPKQHKEKLILLPSRLTLQTDTLGAVINTVAMKEKMLQSTSAATLQEAEDI